MRRYELMLVLRPDLAEDRVQATLDRITRSISAAEGQLVKVSPWGRRRLAYPIGQFREGSYYIVLFDAPSPAVDEIEQGPPHHRGAAAPPGHSRRTAGGSPAGGGDGTGDGATVDEEEEPLGEFIDESESEAAPAAID